LQDSAVMSLISSRLAGEKPDDNLGNPAILMTRR
jgi:hypothetical protein